MINTASQSKKNDQLEGSYKTYCIAVVPKVAYDRMALYWLNVPVMEPADHSKITAALSDVLCDPLQEELWVVEPSQRDTWVDKWRSLGYAFWAEKQFAPGVTDNLAHTVAEALKLLKMPKSCKVASGTGYLFKAKDDEQASRSPNQDAREKFASVDEVDESSKYKLYHPIVEKWRVHDLVSGKTEFFAFPDVALPAAPAVAPISLELTDEQLTALSRDRLLALTLEEMHAGREYFRKPEIIAERKKHNLTSEPTDVELEVIAQTWSEHCKHKIFNASIEYTEVGPGVAGTSNNLKIKSLYKTYIQAPTKELAKKRTDLLSVFKDKLGRGCLEQHDSRMFQGRNA